MKVYISGRALTPFESVLALFYDKRMISYRYRDDMRVFIRAVTDSHIVVTTSMESKLIKKVELFLDSGAFSAWSKGVKIDVQDYIAFIKKYRKYISLYAVLDVIGDAEGTWKNQQIMEEAGLSPLPCFHFGEPFKYLKRYIEEYDYIALGGLAKRGMNKNELYAFLDRCFDMICDKRGLPQIKVHGFGVTGLQTMLRYPWYSVDSTTWVLTARMGGILVPSKLPDGNWDYLERQVGKQTRKISVSTISPSSAVPDQHFSTISKQWQKEVLEWLEQHDTKLGKSSFRKVPVGYKLKDGERWVKSPGVGESDSNMNFGKRIEGSSKEYIEIVEEPGVSNDYVQRDVINAKYFKELEAHFPKWPWMWKRPVHCGFGL